MAQSKYWSANGYQRAMEARAEYDRTVEDGQAAQREFHKALYALYRLDQRLPRRDDLRELHELVKRVVETYGTFGRAMRDAEDQWEVYEEAMLHVSE